MVTRCECEEPLCSSRCSRIDDLTRIGRIERQVKTRLPGCDGAIVRACRSQKYGGTYMRRLSMALIAATAVLSATPLLSRPASAMPVANLGVAANQVSGDRALASGDRALLPLRDRALGGAGEADGVGEAGAGGGN